MAANGHGIVTVVGGAMTVKDVLLADALIFMRIQKDRCLLHIIYMAQEYLKEYFCN
jgi:hypothetical protein